MLATDDVREHLYAYMLYHELGMENTVMLFAGHSRGGAVANILAAYLNDAQTLVLQENLHVYTFAAPRTTRSPNPAHTNIFNIINVNDRVPRLPRTMGWTNLWGRHGVDLAVHMTTTTVIGLAVDAMYHHTMENYLRWMLEHPGLTYAEFHAMSVPITTIFGTTWPATWYYWLLFWLGFGWIWMYLWV
ncbi:MAG: lipase family protein [Oscillospiraceae bacterium]|nr:lipase family protein [Oscillospiraceae bacterium]